MVFGSTMLREVMAVTNDGSTIDPPENVRNLPVTSDESLSTEEKEVRMVASNDDEEFVIGTEIPTVMKWLQSVPHSTFEWVRLNGEGSMIGCKAKIPKGGLKLQQSARKSNTHSQMVSYGNLRGGVDD